MCLVKKIITIVLLATTSLLHAYSNFVRIDKPDIPDYVSILIPYKFTYTLTNIYHRSLDLHKHRIEGLGNTPFHYEHALSSCEKLLPPNQSCELVISFFTEEAASYNEDFYFIWSNGFEEFKKLTNISVATNSSRWVFINTNNSDLPHNRINSLVYDEISGIKLYLATANGVAILNTLTGDFNNKLSAEYMLDIIIHDNKVYAAGRNGLFIADITNDNFSSAIRQGLPRASAINAVAVQGEQLFVGTTSGLATLPLADPTQFTLVNTMPESINDIKFNAAGEMIVATQKGAYINKSGNTFTKLNILTDKQATSISIYNNTVLVGTIDGVAISHDGGNTFSERILTGKYVTDIFTGNDIRFITTTNGLFAYYKDNVIDNDIINAFNGISLNKIIFEAELAIVGGTQGLAILS